MRYKARAVRYTGDMNAMPQRLLMPSVHDASLWQVRVKVDSATFFWIFVILTHIAAWSRARDHFQPDA